MLTVLVYIYCAFEGSLCSKVVSGHFPFASSKANLSFVNFDMVSETFIPMMTSFKSCMITELTVWLIDVIASWIAIERASVLEIPIRNDYYLIFTIFLTDQISILYKNCLNFETHPFICIYIVVIRPPVGPPTRWIFYTEKPYIHWKSAKFVSKIRKIRFENPRSSYSPDESGWRSGERERRRKLLQPWPRPRRMHH